MEIPKDHKDSDNNINIKENSLTTVVVGSTKYYTKLTKKFENKKKWEKPDDKKLLSAIPGTIRDIFVKQGDEVNINDKLLILEAMKMNNIIYSNISGRIKSVFVNSGDRIPGNSVLIEFE